MSAFFASRQRFFCLAALCLPWMTGCEEPEPIISYTIPTKVPEQFLEGQDRMLAVMLPKGDDVWFFKVTGPELAIANVESPFKNFVSEISFDEAGPQLKELPEGWRRAGKKPMRFASINIDTPSKQLDLSVSKLSRQEDWDNQVKMNVNRWRGQVGLEPSEDRWAGGEVFQSDSADADGIWVDLVGKSTGASMSPPFARGGGSLPAGHPNVNPNRSDPPSEPGKPPTPSESPNPPSAPDNGSPPKNRTASDERLKFDRPEGWRDGRMRTMRMAAFNVGPEDAPAEITVIPAGGDLPGNVKRWMGQVLQAEVTDEQLEQAMSEAAEVEVSGIKGHRYVLLGDQETIDATIVPIDNGMSLFIKMKGPTETVTDQSEAISQFIESIKLNL